MPPITTKPVSDSIAQSEQQGMKSIIDTFVNDPATQAQFDSVQYLSVEAIKDGFDKGVIDALSKAPDFENQLLKWEIAKLHARNYNLSPTTAFQMVDQLNADYLTGAPVYKSAARSILDSGRAASLMLKLGKTASEYMGSALGFGDGPSDEDKAVLQQQMDIMKKDIAGLQIDDMPKNWMKSWLKDVASIVPYTADVAFAGAAAAGATALAGATAGVSGAAWFSAAKAFVSSTVRFAEAFNITRGLNFLEMRERGIPEKEAIYWSDASAAAASAIEAFIGTEAFLGNAISGTAKTALVEKIVTRMGVSGLLTSQAGKFIGRISLQALGEMTEEASQSFVDGIATIFAEEAAGLDTGLDPMSWRQVGRSMAESAWKAAVTAPLLGLPGAAIQLVRDKAGLADMAAKANGQTKDSFEAMAISSGVFSAPGVSIDEQKRLAGLVWQRQADAKMSAQKTAGDLTRERAKAGKMPGDAEVQRLPSGELLLTETATDTQGEVSVLVGSPSSPTDIYGEVTILPSDTSVIISGADIRAGYVGLTQEILGEIARRYPGRELILSESAQDDQAISGGYEAFVESNGSAISMDKPLGISEPVAMKIRESLETNGIDKKAVDIAVPFMTVLKRAAGVEGDQFESGVEFGSMASQDVAGVFKEEIDNVTGAVRDVIKIGTNYRGELQAQTLMHELVHYFRSFVSRHNPDSPELKAIEKELGVVDGRWFEAADEQLVKMVEARLAKRDTAGAKDFLAKVSEFLRSLYEFFDETTAPEAKAALDSWFRGNEDLGDVESLFVPEDKIGKLKWTERSEVKTFKGLYEKSKSHIDEAAAKFGKEVAYYQGIFNQYYRYINTLKRRFAGVQYSSPFYRAFSAALRDGSWVINPQFVAWIKRGLKEELTQDEADILNIAESSTLFSKLESKREIDDDKFIGWFGESKVVNQDGSPKVVYHGTSARFESFIPSKGGAFGPGIYFTTDIKEAENYAAMGESPQIIESYVKIEHPFVDSDGHRFWDIYGRDDSDSDAVQRAIADGYDGIIYQHIKGEWTNDGPRQTGEPVTHYIIWDNTHVKSVDNTGEWGSDDPRILYSIIEENDNLNKVKAQTGTNTDPSAYPSLEAWMESMFANIESMSDRDKAWFKSRYEYAHSQAAKTKQFPKRGDFIAFLRKGNNFFNFIYNINKAIHGGDRFSNSDMETRADRIEAAISKTPEIKALVDAMNDSGKRPSSSDMQAFISKASKNEALYKYLYAMVSADENLAHEAVSDLSGIPELVKLEMTGSRDVTIADQEEILDALRGSELEEKVASGTITIEELDEYIKRMTEDDKKAYEEYIKEFKKQSKEAIKAARAEGAASEKGNTEAAKAKIKETRDRERAKLKAYKEKVKAYNAAKRLRTQMNRVIKSIFKSPSSRTDQWYGSLILAIQEALAAKKEVKKEDLAWANSFRGQYDQRWNDRLDQFIVAINTISKLTNDQIPLDVAISIANQIKSLEAEGIRAKRDMDASWSDVTTMIRGGIMSDLMRGKYWKEAVMPGTEEEKSRQKKLDQMAKWFDADRPDAWFRKYLGPTASALMFDESLRARSAKFENYDRRVAPITDYISKNHMMRKDRLLREVTLENIWGPDRAPMTVTGSELVGIRLLVGRKDDFNEYQRKAFIYGNTFSSQQKSDPSADDGMTGEYQDKLDTILKFLDDNMTDEEEELANLMLVASNNDNDWYRFASTMVYLSNKEPRKESFYFPIIRQGSFEEGEDEVLDRLKDFAMEAKLDGGMAISRNNITPKNHKQVKYDALEVFFNAIAKQEHLIEVGPYIKRLRGVFRHGKYSDALRNGIKQSLGQKAMDYIDDQIDTLTNPSEYKEKASGAEALTFWKGSMVVSNLAWRWSSVLMQTLTSPLPGYAEAPLHMLPSSIKAYTNPIGFIANVEAQSPILKHRQLTSEQAVLEKRAQLGKANFLENLGRLGMKPLSWADRISVAIVWDAVKQKQMDAGASEVEAADYADRFIIQTQPTAEEADRAPMYRDPNAFKQLVLQFTQPLNVIYNNIRNDIPEAAKEQEFGKIIGFITAYAMSGLAIGAIGVLRGRGPEDDDSEAWTRYFIHASTSQFTDSIPFIGQIVTGLTGYAITRDNNSWLMLDKNMPAIDSIARGVSALMKESGPDYKKFLLNAAKGLGMMSGAPVKAAEEYYKLIEQAF